MRNYGPLPESENSIMPVGIIGANGFIGSYLMKYLKAKSADPLRLLLRTNFPQSHPADVEGFPGDLTSRKDCERFAANLSVIYYLAHTNVPLNSDADWTNDA